MVDINKYMDEVKDWFQDFLDNCSDTVDAASKYFKGCSQQELMAWAGIGIGIICCIIGIVILLG